MRADHVIMVDWSAAAVPVRAGPNAIWVGEASAAGTEIAPRHFPTRAGAGDWLAGRIADTIARGKRAVVGFDFAFGYPAGFAARLTGRAHAFAIWNDLAARVSDDELNRNNRFAVAAALNAALSPVPGPFWGRPNGQDIPHLSAFRPTPAPETEIAARRIVEARLRMAGGEGRAVKSVWQVAYAGSVGGQILTGLPLLHRLRRRFGRDLAVWPFEAHPAPVTLCEIYPALIARAVAGASAEHPVADARQVSLMARAFARLAAEGRLDEILSLPGDLTDAERRQVTQEEGWIAGAFRAELLMAALSRRCP